MVQNIVGQIDVSDPRCPTPRMVYCRVPTPYSRPAHLIESDDPSRGRGNCDAPRSYVKRWRNVSGDGAGTISARKPHHATRRYGES